MYQDEYKRWLAADLEDADLKPELAKVEGNEFPVYFLYLFLHIQLSFNVTLTIQIFLFFFRYLHQFI